MRGVAIGFKRSISFLALTTAMSLGAFVLMMLLTIPPRLAVIGALGAEPDWAIGPIVWTCFAVTCATVYSVFRLGERWAALPGLELFGYLVSSAAVFTLCLAGFMFVAGVIAETGVAVFTVGYGALKLFLLALDNFLKVLLFDVLEVFEVNVSSMQPQNWVARLFIVCSRILFSVLVVRNLIEIISWSRFPKPLAIAPTKGARRALFAAYAISLLALAGGAAGYLAFGDML